MADKLSFMELWQGTHQYHYAKKANISRIALCED